MELIFAIILTLMLLGVAYFDVTKFIIPNKLNLAFIALWVVFLPFAEPFEWWWSLAVMGVFFAVGILIFMTNIMGGGDVKLIIALSLWIGWDPAALTAFGIWTALSGGVLALFLLFTRWIIKRSNRNKKVDPQIPKVFKWNEPLPYGLAIAYAFGYLLWNGRIQGLEAVGF